MTMDNNSALLVTEFAQFYRATSGEVTRYYAAASAALRITAFAFNNDQPAPTIGGYGVYDTTISAEYAVAVYADKKDADAHKAVAAPEAPTTLFSEPHGGDTTESQSTKGKPKKRFPSKRK